MQTHPNEPGRYFRRANWCLIFIWDRGRSKKGERDKITRKKKREMVRKVYFKRPPFWMWPMRRYIFQTNYCARKPEKSKNIEHECIRKLINKFEGKKYYRNPVLDFYLLSGASSPSNLILNLMPTENLLLTASRYLFKPIMNWLVLDILKEIMKEYEKSRANNSIPKKKIILSSSGLIK